MKKALICLAIIIAAAVAILNIIPVTAKSSTAIKPATVVTDTAPIRGIILPKSTSTAENKSATASVPAPAKIIPPKKPTPAPVKKSAVVSSSGVTWTASGLKAIGSLASFDYSTSIRNSYKRKVEAYARSKNIKQITAAVVNSMHQ